MKIDSDEIQEICLLGFHIFFVILQMNNTQLF